MKVTVEQITPLKPCVLMLFCPKCKYPCAVRFLDGKSEEIKQPNAKTQSRTGCEVKFVLHFVCTSTIRKLHLAKMRF